MSPSTIVVVIVVVTFGSFVQSVAGFGMNLLAVPVLLLAGAEELVPGALLVVLFSQSLSMALRERGQADWNVLRWFLPVRVLGTISGVFVATRLSGDGTTYLTCALVLAATLLSMAGWRVPATPGPWMATGFASGFSNVISSIGGPPLALALVDHTPPAHRATQGWSGMFGSVMSVSLLALAGDFEISNLWWGIGLIPTIVVGSTLGGFARQRLPTADSLRPWVWTIAIVGSLAAIARAAFL
jgi:uncharacterized protein